MRHDIDTIIERVRACHPDAVVDQLKVAHPGADDDGLWYFGLPGGKVDVQVESGTYDAPFLVEGVEVSPTGIVEGASVDQVVEVVSSFLDRIRGRST